MYSKRRNKILGTVFGTSILVVAISIGTIAGIKAALNNKSEQFEEFNWTSSTTPQDAVQAIEKSESINSFKEQSLNFLDAKVYTYETKVNGTPVDEAEEKAQAYVQNYLYEFQEKINQYYDTEYFETKKSVFASPLSDAYSCLNTLNNKYSIDPIDYYQFKNKIFPKLKTQLLQNTKIYQKQNDEARINRISDLLYTHAVNNNLTAFQFNSFLSNELVKLSAEEGTEPAEEEKQKSNSANFLKEVVKMLENKKITINENPEINFPGLLAAYSADGKTGYSLENNVLSQEDVYKIVLAQRDPLFGIRLTSFFGNVDYSSTTLPSSLKDNLSQGVTPSAPLDELNQGNSELANYKKGEILPGVVLHLKISSIDYSSDSKYAKVRFQVGISQTILPDGGITWISEQNEDTSDYSPAEKSYLAGLFSVNTFEQKLNCANNNFYPNDIYLEYSNKIFDWTKIKERTGITQMLNNAPVDASGRYTMTEQNPFFIDVANFKLDGLPVPHQLENTHANEKVMLKVADVNTNFSTSFESIVADTNCAKPSALNPYAFKDKIPYIKVQWAIVDIDPQDPTQYREIKQYKWKYNTAVKENEYLPFYFSYTDDELTVLQTAKTLAGIVHDFGILAYKDANGKNLIDNIHDTMKTLGAINISLGGATLGLCLWTDILSFFTTISTGAFLFDAFFLVLDLLMAASTIAAGIGELKLLPDLQQLSDLVNTFGNYVPKSVIDMYTEYYNILVDPRMSVQKKMETAWMSTHYLFIFVPKFYEFLEKALATIEDEEFMPFAKWVLSFYTSQGSKLRSFLNFLIPTFAGNDKGDMSADDKLWTLIKQSKDEIMDKGLFGWLMEQNGISEMLEIYPKTTVKAVIDSSDAFSTITNLAFGLKVSLRPLSIVMAQFFLWKNITIKESWWWDQSLKSETDNLISDMNSDHVAIAKIDGNDSVFHIVNTDSQVGWTRAERDGLAGQIEFASQKDGDKFLKNFKEYNTGMNTRGPKTKIITKKLEQWEKDIWSADKLITTKENAEKFIKKQKVKPTTAFTMGILGLMIVAIGVAQYVATTCIPVIPDDKADSLKKLSNLSY